MNHLALVAQLGMSPSGWIAIVVTFTIFVLLQVRRGAPSDLLFLAGLVTVMTLGVITPARALAGFANPAVLTIGSLFVVASALRSTGVLDYVGNRLLGNVTSVGSALFRLMATILGLSAFINNTPVVAMFVPIVLDWCRKRGVSPSKMLIPMSYVAIMGGTCTLIGTSTNIIINGLMREQEGMAPMTLLEIGKVGFPCAMVGAAYLFFVGRHLLPNRMDLIERLGEHRREYLVEMLVQPECRLIGKTVQAAGLRHLRGLFLIEIDRNDELITPVTPEDLVHEGDRLIFTGVVTTIVDLVKIPGLVPAADMKYEIHPQKRASRHLSEAVISRSSPLVGRTIRKANFRRLYNAAVVAVHRNGVRLTNKVGDAVIEPGDTLLLQTRTEFADQFRHSRDFFLVSRVEGSQPRRHDRAWIATGPMLLSIVWLFVVSWLQPTGQWQGLGQPVVAALGIAVLMIVLRCVSTSQARSEIDLQVLITIGAALGMGAAITDSGAADVIADMLVQSVGVAHPLLLLATIYIISLIFTELITNVAVAAMMFPLGMEVAEATGCDPRPFAMAIAIAASLSFITPIGYQTNLMVMGPGGYEPRDYLRIGLPMVVLVTVTALVLIPRVWPL